jgi:methionyl-tRNA formyltransferase
MKVLYLANSKAEGMNEIPDFIRAGGDEVVIHTARIDLPFVQSNGIEFLVSDRATFLIKQDVIDYLPRKVVNLHPSALPWCRGYFPNYWSIKTKAPYGVTLHFVDADIDTGDIIAQTLCSYSPEDTLRDTYERARMLMVGLFKTCWPQVRLGKMTGMPQDKSAGSLHYKRDFDGVLEKLPHVWDTKVRDV